MTRGYYSFRIVSVLSTIFISICLSASISFAQTESIEIESIDSAEATLQDDAAETDQAVDTETIKSEVAETTTEALAVTVSDTNLEPGEIIKLQDAPGLPENNMLMGTLTYKVSIKVPTGRLGMTPDLSLIYNSNQNNGWIGVGWTLDMGSIQRNTKKGLDYGENDFVYIKNGSSRELVPNNSLGPNYYQAKIDDGQFSKYYINPLTDGWEVTAKDGTKYYYGKTPYDATIDSRQTNAQGTFKWCLTWVQDTNGNYTKITYFKDQGEIYLSRIDYTGNQKTNLAPGNYILFNLENARTDIPLKYNTFSSVKTIYRLKSIELYGNTILAGKYEFEYDADIETPENQNSSNTDRSLLTKIKRHGSDNTKLPQDMMFIWNQGLPQYDGNDYPYTQRSKDFSSYSNGYYYIYYGLPRLGDVNGDGKSDIVYDDDDRYVHVLLSTGEGFTEDSKNGWVKRAKNYGSNNPGFQVADFNGDGKTDFIYEDGKKYYHVLLSTGDDFTEDVLPYWGKRSKSYNSSYKFIQTGDVNGDGKADIVYEDGNKKYHILFSTGSGFTLDSDVGCGKRLSSYGYSFRLSDLNNDGKYDIYYVDDKKKIHVLLSNGNCFLTDTQWGLMEKNNGSYPYELGDVNGDGLPDFVYEDKNKDIRVLINIGSSFTTDDDLSIWGKRDASLNSNSGGPKLVDFNGDGLADFVYEHKKTIYTMQSIGYRDTVTGIGFLPEQLWGTRISGYKSSDPGLRIADIDGDGLVDLLYEGGGNTFRGLKGQQPYPDLINTITNDLGGTYAITYEPSSSYQNTIMPFIVQTVSSITINDGLGRPDSSSTKTYNYSDGYYDYTDREFRGFGYVEQTTPDNTSSSTWFHQKETEYDGSPAYCFYKDTSTYILDDKDFQGRACHTEFIAPDQTTLISQTDLKWERPTGSVKGNYPVFVKMTEKTTRDYLGGVETFSKEVNVYDDTNGNLLSVEASGTDGEKLVTATQYQNLGTWLWRPIEASIIGVSDNGYTGSGLRRKTEFEYYSDGTGNLWKKKSFLEGVPENEWPTITMEYTSEGNLWKQWDAKLNLTTTEYDTETKTYPHIITYPSTYNNTVSHVVEQNYDYRFGKPESTKDENGNWTYYAYDPFGRLIQTDYPDGGQTTTEYYDSSFPIYTISKVKETELGQMIDKYDHYDGLGRSIQTVTLGEPDELGQNKTIATRTIYDNMGRIFSTEGPFFGADFSYPQTPLSDYPYTEIKYNLYGLPDTITSPDTAYGTVSTHITYSGLSTIITDPDTRQKKETNDYLGRLIKVTEYADEGEQYTNYTYDAAGDLETVTDHAGNVTTINYDTLGRKINMQDPDMGYWQYTYEPDGNLKTQTDAKLQTITFDYDELNRVKTKAYSTGDPTVTYTYDNLSIPNGRGRLYSLANTKTLTTYNVYDQMGRVKSITKTIEGNPTAYTTQTEYDLSGKPTVLTYPDTANSSITNTYYPGTGLLHQVTGYNGVIYSTNTLYEPTGKMGQIDHSNGVFTRYSYDSKSTRLTGILSTAYPDGNNPLNDIINKSYSYTPAGDIAIITDYKKGAEMGLSGNIFDYEYQYDKLHRLKTEAFKNNTGTDISTSFSPVNYTYNAIGNIMSKTSATTLQYTYNNPLHKHAVDSITVNGNTYSSGYDDNGNMSSVKIISGVVLRTAKYDINNMPIEIIQGPATTTFDYDGEGARVKKTGPFGTTYYIGRHYEIINGDPTGYIFAGNLRIAKVAASGTYFFHKDHLGSSSAMTTDVGTIVETSNYMPFGEQREHTGSTLTNYKFTDQELDTETGLYNYDARLYDPMTGRFISPDTIVPDYSNPQSLNRYSYANNNPLIYKDPTGHWPDPVHYGDTRQIFEAVGFPNWMACIVASYDLQVDYGSKSSMPWGDQSWHFNADRSADYATLSDTRLIHFQEQVGKTYEAIGKGDAVTALQEYGAGLHPRQDTFAHSPQYVHDIGIFFHWPSWLGGGADVPSINSAAYQTTIAWTANRAQELYDVMSSQGMITDYDPRTCFAGNSGYNFDFSYSADYGQRYNSNFDYSSWYDSGYGDYSGGDSGDYYGGDSGGGWSLSW